MTPGKDPFAVTLHRDNGDQITEPISMILGPERLPLALCSFEIVATSTHTNIDEQLSGSRILVNRK